MTRRGRTPSARWLGTLGIGLPLALLGANSFGWIFTEMGRQPWAVFGLMTTERAVSPGVSVFEAATSLVVLTLVYAVLAVIEVRLIISAVTAGRRAVRASRRTPSGADSARRRRPARVRLLTREIDMELTTIWFVVIAFLWIGYFALEGFDFGVGILLPVLARDETERRVMINTIGPVWDGNEVWLLVAGGATFAAFPHWYATLFSGFYLPLLLILVALIVRGVAFEYRHQRHDAQWQSRWDKAIFFGSLVPAVLWGVAFANIVAGVPIDADMEFTGSLFTLLNPFGLLGGLVTLTLFVTHGATFIALKTVGDIRLRARALAWKSGLGGRRARRRLPRVAAGADRQRRLGRGVRGRRAAAAGRGRCGVRRPRGRVLRRHVRRDRLRGGGHVRRALPRRDAVLDGRRVQPDHDQRGGDVLHPDDHDVGGGDLHAARAGLPGVDLLGLPQADRHPPHPDGGAGRSR